MAKVGFSAECDEFSSFVYENRQLIRDMARRHPEVVEMLVLGYRVGITNGSGACNE